MPYFDTALPKPYGTAQVRRVVRLFPTKKKGELRCLKAHIYLEPPLRIWRKSTHKIKIRNMFERRKRADASIDLSITCFPSI